MRKMKKLMTITLLFIAIIPMIVFASTLKLKIKTDKAKYEIGDNVVVTVDWIEKMQAASYKIKYDSDILELKSASIASTYYNTDTVGEISVNWASMEEKDLTYMTFEFYSKKTGSASITIKEVEAFADGNMVAPTDYNFESDGSVNISINAKNSSENVNNTSGEKNNMPNTKIEEKATENTIKAYSSKEENTKVSSKLPNTGIVTTIIPILIIGILGGIGYIKYRKLSGI